MRAGASPVLFAMAFLECALARHIVGAQCMKLEPSVFTAAAGGLLCTVGWILTCDPSARDSSRTI